MAPIVTESEWDRFKERVNQDEEMKVRGHDHFSENFYLHMGDDTVLVKMYQGEVEEVETSPDLNDHGSIIIEGSEKAWNEFLQEVPPPHNNELIASDYRTSIKGEEDYLNLTGDYKKFFQSLRPLQRTLEILRETKNEGA